MINVHIVKQYGVPLNTFQDPDPPFLNHRRFLLTPLSVRRSIPLKLFHKILHHGWRKFLILTSPICFKLSLWERIHKISIHEQYSFSLSKKLLVPPFLNHPQFSCLTQGRLHKFQSGGEQITNYSRSVDSFWKH